MRPLFKITFLALCLMGVQLLSATSTQQDYVKTIKKDFANVNPAGTTFLSNKYGKIDVKTGTQNQVSITVKITVRTASKSDADDVFERIKIQFSSGSDFVKANTEIESQSWWSSWWSSSCDYSIDYEVFMPPTNRLNLQNKYGNSFVAPLESSATLDISYGDFRLEKIPGALNISLAYGNGNVINCKDMNCAVSYGDLHVVNASDLVLNTKYSDVHVDKALDIKTTSRYDDYDINSVRDLTSDSQYGGFKVASANSLNLISRYTDFQAGRVASSATIDMNYGGLVISNLAKGFSSVNIKGAYTDVSIDVEAGASYRVDAATTYADISYPTGTKASVDSEKGSSREFKGVVGASASPAASITARLSYGGLVLK